MYAVIILVKLAISNLRNGDLDANSSPKVEVIHQESAVVYGGLPILIF